MPPSEESDLETPCFRLHETCLFSPNTAEGKLYLQTLCITTQTMYGRMKISQS